MEQQKPKTGQFALRFGLLMGALGITFSLMLHFMDLQYTQSAANSVVGIAIILGILITAIYQYKKANGGYLSLTDALKVGIGAALVGGIISALYTMLYANVIEPDFLERSGEMMRSTLRNDNPDLTTEQIENAVQSQRDFFWVTYPILIIFNLFVGFIVSLVIGLIMRKEQSDY
ncbi:DUF4199 domain-containing protein [Robertkochia flava]|uniref:DUF4199 domain-containing protein n=1 Tax=Robertkochia flava TaxID=3447986 RepID=UPI001CCB17FC|nr:DUF4199 domain-containing protein [Robertkochia marina]